MKNLIRLVSLVATLVLQASPALAIQKVALVIGNSDYASSPLSDAINDVDLMTQSLRKLGFEVEPKKDVNQKEMRTLIKNFYEKIKAQRDTVGLFYYSGHGMQVDGRNYLIPIGAEIYDESDVKIESVAVDDILSKMRYAGNSMNFIFLDACRNNPYEKSFKSGDKGLGKLDAPKGTLIAFASLPNTVALQGSGRYSTFTEALAQEILTPDISVHEMLRRVRVAVDKKTDGKQTPMVEDMLLSQFYFNESGGEIPVQPTSTPVTKAKAKKFQDPINGMELVWVEGGCFQMGDTFGDGDADEKPVHEVCVDGFYMGKYEVTQGQWKKIMRSNPSNFKSGDDYPVESVSWDDTQEFIGKLNSQTGNNYRLPTEAEWEYAARSGGKKEKYSGSDSIDSVAWYTANSGGKTHRIGTKNANGLGLHDMSGNVYEWCSDWYGENYYSSSSRNNPQGPSIGSLRVFRGGGWGHDAWSVRSAGRYWVPPDDRSDFLGFRLVLPPSQ